MALRGCVILLFILLSGTVYADDTTMTLAPGTQEPSTVTQTGSPSSSAAPPATSPATTEAQTAMTTEAKTTMTTAAQTTNSTTEAPTTHHNPTTEAPTTHHNPTTEAPTTHHNPTTEAPTMHHNSTTEAPTTHINSTTEAPTTHHNSTTEAPTTHHNSTTEAPTTTHHNTTNSTTEAPTTAHTNATTAPTPPPTTPPIPKPTVGNYSVRSDVNSSICLLAKMGLQFSFATSGNASRQTVNVDPNVTTASGTCGSGGRDSSLVLSDNSGKITVHFVFTNVSDKFRLHSLVLMVDIGQGSFFNESVTNLSLWEASIGSSYMCRKEQSYNVSDKLTLNTFELQVQPFAVQKNAFSTAHECSMDDISLLIPIIVGAVLAGLIFIVVIAYVIGRRRTYVGYQTL